MRVFSMHTISLGLAVFLLYTPVWGIDKGDIVVELTAKKVVSGAGGKETYEPADMAKPGDIIEYSAVYKNTGKEAVKDLKGTLPVPKEMEYQPGTAVPADIQASLDGKKYASVPLKKKVRLPNGREEIREIPYAEYRYLRWAINELSPGQSVTVSARMKLGEGASPKDLKVKTGN